MAEIGINWVLNQDIPSRPEGGYVRILAESLLCEERPGKTRIRITKGLTTCMEPNRQSRAAIRFFYESDGWTENKS